MWTDVQKHLENYVHFFKNQHMSLRKQPFLKLSYKKITAATGIPFDQHDMLGNVIRLS